MGLDIYFYKVKAQNVETMTNDDITRLNELRKTERNKDIPNFVRVGVNDLIDQCLVEDDKCLREEIFLLLKPFIKYTFDENAIRKCDANKLADSVASIYETYATFEDMYYRKVNSLYAYFANRLDCEQSIVTKADVEDILDRANKVILAHDDSVSAELLPTQSGFFFGSTSYDEWYYSDVEDIHREFTKYLEDWTDDTIGWVHFSW
jgi:hypothetical protein